MANNFYFQDKQFKIGDYLEIKYKISEGEKIKTQNFSGFLIGIKGSNNNNKMITIRKISKFGIGVERIFPLFSPYLTQINLLKNSYYQKAKAYFIRHLSQKELRKRLFHKK